MASLFLLAFRLVILPVASPTLSFIRMSLIWKYSRFFLSFNTSTLTLISAFVLAKTSNTLCDSHKFLKFTDQMSDYTSATVLQLWLYNMWSVGPEFFHDKNQLSSEFRSDTSKSSVLLLIRYGKKKNCFP